MTIPMPEPLKHNTKAFPHVSPDDSEGSCFICYAEMNPEVWVTPKYLTDAECAAHAWQSALGWMRDDIGRDMGFPSDEMKYKTWHRFATRPHALKETT